MSEKQVYDWYWVEKKKQGIKRQTKEALQEPRKQLDWKSEYQTEALKEYFQLIPVWTKDVEEQIAEKLEMTVRQVKSWKWKQNHKLKK